MKGSVVIFLLGLSLILAIVTRFYMLGSAPAGLYLDEAAQGYNAYSILKTGKDEFGKTYPAVFRSFTDFKTPVYIYLIVPLIPLFDLTKFTVRFPSFFFSILTIPVLFLLLKKIIKDKSSPALPLISSFVLALSPWHILFGRTNFECNVALFFLIAAIYTFYIGLENPKILIISALFFAIAIPAYHAQRVVTPLMMLFLFIRHRKKLLSAQYKKCLFLGSVIGFLILIPTLRVALTPGFLVRAAGLNIFNTVNHTSAGSINNCKGVFCPIINNNFYLGTKEFMSLYLSYFSPRELFVLGDFGKRSSFPNLSTHYLWQFPFYIYGFYLLLSKKWKNELKYFTLTFLLVSPVPAALTRDPYSTIRSLQMVVPLSIIISLGIYGMYENIRQKFRFFDFGYYRLTGIILSVLVILYSLARLYSSVILLNEYYRPQEWNYGFEQVVQDINKLDDLPIVVDNSRTEPYSQLLFFLKFDPSVYQQDNFEVQLNEYYTNLNRNKTKKIGRILTRPIDWKLDTASEKYLIGDSLAISQGQIEEHRLTLIDKIKYPDGSDAFIITKTNPILKN